MLQNIIFQSSKTYLKIFMPRIVNIIVLKSIFPEAKTKNVSDSFSGWGLYLAECEWHDFSSNLQILMKLNFYKRLSWTMNDLCDYKYHEMMK